MLTLDRCIVSVVALGCALLAGCAQSSGTGGGYSTGQPRVLAAAPAVLRFRASSPGVPSVPTIAGISPTTGTAGTQVTITGTGFVNLTDVRIGGVQVVNIEYLPTQIVGTVGQALTGAADVVVYSPLGNATLTQGFFFEGSPGDPTPPASDSITYTSNVAPIIQHDCIQCHGGFATYAGLRAQVTPGNSAGSTLIINLSAGGKMQGRMSDADLATVRAWIDAGAPQ